MVKIKFRDDGWFEAGKDAKDYFPFAYLSYQAKQELKQKLTELSGKNLKLDSLEKALHGIEAPRPFKRQPYLERDDIFVDTHGMPGKAYLGSIVE